MHTNIYFQVVIFNKVTRMKIGGILMISLLFESGKTKGKKILPEKLRMTVGLKVQEKLLMHFLPDSYRVSFFLF